MRIGRTSPQRPSTTTLRIELKETTTARIGRRSILLHIAEPARESGQRAEEASDSPSMTTNQPHAGEGLEVEHVFRLIDSSHSFGCSGNRASKAPMESVADLKKRETRARVESESIDSNEHESREHRERRERGKRLMV